MLLHTELEFIIIRRKIRKKFKKMKKWIIKHQLKTII